MSIIPVYISLDTTRYVRKGITYHNGLDGFNRDKLFRLRLQPKMEFTTHVLTVALN